MFLLMLGEKIVNIFLVVSGMKIVAIATKMVDLFVVLVLVARTADWVRRVVGESVKIFVYV